MAIKKKGLGRGLGALGLESPKEIFESQSSQKDHGEEAGARLTELSVEQLRQVSISRERIWIRRLLLLCRPRSSPRD